MKKIFDAVLCTSCKSNRVALIGTIPASNFFAGRYLKNPIQGGCLYRCASCDLYFRFPKLSKRDLENSYKQEDSDGRWVQNFNDRFDWKIAADWIDADAKICNVLDVGCNDGTFLIGLSARHAKYGIELNPAASNRAMTEGIAIIGSEIEASIQSISLKFDCITAFDVIEHVDDPMGFLELLESKLSLGGEIIISSGNTDCWSWKLMGSKYWYCAPPEHITFINLHWAEIAAARLKLSLVDSALFAHSKGSYLQCFLEFLKNVTYKLFPALIVWMRSNWLIKGKLTNLGPPSWITARDHLLLRFRK